jgi:hypothetical protein
VPGFGFPMCEASSITSFGIFSDPSNSYGGYVASAPHSWTMRIRPTETRGVGWN